MNLMVGFEAHRFCRALDGLRGEQGSACSGHGQSSYVHGTVRQGWPRVRLLEKPAIRGLRYAGEARVTNPWRHDLGSPNPLLHRTRMRASLSLSRAQASFWRSGFARNRVMVDWAVKTPTWAKGSPEAESLLACFRTDTGITLAGAVSFIAVALLGT